MMGSFRRPRPRFMSSPVLSDLARFHASSPSLSNTRVWNSVQSAVMQVFQGSALQTNELFTLNESIRWLLKTEMGSFITDYFQNQLLTQGLSEVLDQVQLHSGDEQLVVLGNVWDRFFTEILPTLQAIFYPVQGQELSVRQISLLAFRDLVLLKLHLQDDLRTASFVPAAVKQMLLVLQGVHDAPSLEFCQLERLVEVVVTPFIRDALLTDPPRHQEVRAPSPGDALSLGPLVETEGEAYLEKTGGVRRHTVANVHCDEGGVTFMLGAGPMAPKGGRRGVTCR
ncbi:proline-rich protein 5-like [Pseudochaenichthys georgianus]|uniref:proline-rich protein 5-like n=1 Tax=Pseudochaenichthys georgianus TaxID=52239 RepID=UPI00146CDC0A|nr:proline-rich protein 5-like [Pseudochaenichthys georgianus]